MCGSFCVDFGELVLLCVGQLGVGMGDCDCAVCGTF